jgi:hypothetical protein
MNMREGRGAQRRKRKRKRDTDPLRCISGKTRAYDSQEAAEAELFRLQQIARERGRSVPIRSYECGFCGKWHYTSKRGSLINEHLAPDRPPMLHTPHGSYYALAVAAELLGLSQGKLRRQAARGIISIYEDKYVPVEDVERTGTWQEQGQENLREASG